MSRDFGYDDPEEVTYPGAFGFLLSLGLVAFGWVFYTYSAGDPIWYYYGLVLISGGGVFALLFLLAWLVRPIYLPAVVEARNEEEDS